MALDMKPRPFTSNCLHCVMYLESWFIAGSFAVLDVGPEELPPPTKKDFEALVYKQLTSPHTDIREAFKAMVSLITDSMHS